MVTAKDLGINLWFLSNTAIESMCLWSNSIWKQYNIDYTLTRSNMGTKIFSWVGEENEGENVLNFLAYVKGGLATLG